MTVRMSRRQVIQEKLGPIKQDYEESEVLDEGFDGDHG